MGIEVLNDFVHISDVDQPLINEYKDKLPQEVISLWNEYGFGSFLNGYLKVIYPNDYINLLQDSYFNGNVSIPIFVTAFGDIIIWRENQFVDIVFYRFGYSDTIIAGFEFFYDIISDESIEEHFTLEKYKKAVEMHGELAYNQCFGYVPLLALGGKETTKNLKKVKMREHIYLITQLVGGI